MNGTEMLHEAVDYIEAVDPVASLAANLHASGVTLEKLTEALGVRADAQVGVELREKFQKVAAGELTTNHYGISRSWL